MDSPRLIPSGKVRHRSGVDLSSMTRLLPCFRPRGQLLLSALLLVVLSVGARAGDWQSLLNNPPFGQTGSASTGAPGDLEFRGVVQEEGLYLVNLYNPSTKTAQWIQVNGEAPGVEVKSYDAVSDKVQITSAGRSLTLPLKQAKVALLANASAASGEKSGSDGDKSDRRGDMRDMIRARLEGGGNAEGASFMRNLPPEAQAMIEEFRRRRAENGGGPGQQNRRER